VRDCAKSEVSAIDNPIKPKVNVQESIENAKVYCLIAGSAAANNGRRHRPARAHCRQRRCARGEALRASPAKTFND
jgi:hypothetical protein